MRETERWWRVPLVLRKRMALRAKRAARIALVVASATVASSAGALEEAMRADAARAACLAADPVGERVGQYGPYKHWNWDNVNPFWAGVDTADPHFAARAWVVVLAYLMMDYRYLHL